MRSTGPAGDGRGLFFVPTVPAVPSEGPRAVFESMWQDGVARGLLAAGVSIAAQWAAPKAAVAWRKLRARRAARRKRHAPAAAKAKHGREDGDGGGKLNARARGI